MKRRYLKNSILANISLGICYLLVLSGLLLLLHSQQQKSPHVEISETTYGANILEVRGKNLPLDTSITFVRNEERCSAVVATKFMWGRVFDIKVVTPTDGEKEHALAWALCSNIGLVALDISNLEKPEIIHTIHIDKFLWNLAIQGDKAYIACGKEGIVICDISSLAEARVVTHIPLKYPAVDLSVGPEALYVNHSKNGFSVINPDSGEIIEHLELPGSTLNLAYFNAKLFTLGHESERGFVHIYTVGKGSQLQLHEIIEFEGIPRDYLFWDDCIYLANSSGGVGILKTAPDGSVRFKGSINTPFRSNRLERYGDKLGVFSRNGDVAIYTHGADNTFVLESALNICGKIFSTTIFGDYAIIGANQNGLSIVDLRAGKNPQSGRKATLPSLHNEAKWEVTQNGIVVRHANKIRFYKHRSAPQSSTSNLELTGTIRVPSSMFHNAFTVVENTAVHGAEPETNSVADAWIYAAIKGSGLHVISVAADGTLEKRRIVALPIDGDTQVYSCATYADKLYLCSATGILVFDISTPETPQFLHAEFTEQKAYNITFGTQHAYISGTGVHICPIKPDNTLGVAETIKFPEHLVSGKRSLDITLADGFLYVACGSRGILSIDVRDPQHPIILGSIDLQGYCSKVEARNGFLAAQTSDAVYLLDIRNPRQMGILCKLSDMQDFHIDIHNHEILQLYANGITSIPLPLTLKPTNSSATMLEFHLPTQLESGCYNMFINFNGSHCNPIGNPIHLPSNAQCSKHAVVPVKSSS